MRKLLRPLIVMGTTAAIAFQIAYSATKLRDVAVAQSAPAPSQGEELGSAKWASFVADIRRSHNSQEVFSRFYQNSHGSTRTEAYSPDRKERAVTIHNFERRMSYFESPGGRWAMLPLSPRTVTLPRRFKSDNSGLSAVPEQRLGFTVYEYTSDSGRRSLLAPDLNFFSLFSQVDNDREEVLAVTLGEPAAELFYPPANVQIRQAVDMRDLLRAYPKGR